GVRKPPEDKRTQAGRRQHRAIEQGEPARTQVPLLRDQRGGDPDDEQVIGIGEEPHPRHQHRPQVEPAQRGLIQRRDQVPGPDLRHRITPLLTPSGTLPAARRVSGHCSITAMQESTGRPQRAAGWDQANGFAVISEVVWWVTMVDATLMRYRPGIYSGVLARQEAAQRRITEDTFGGLRFVRNRMGYDTDPADFIQPLDSPPGAAARRIAAWTWKPVPEPALASLTP